MILSHKCRARYIYIVRWVSESNCQGTEGSEKAAIQWIYPVNLSTTTILSAGEHVQFHARCFQLIFPRGGTSGCVVAGRLAENPNVKVLLIEAGQHNKDLENVHMVGGLVFFPLPLTMAFSAKVNPQLVKQLRLRNRLERGYTPDERRRQPPGQAQQRQVPRRV